MSNSDQNPTHALTGSASTLEREIVNTHRVSCDGGGGALGHPRVFIDMGQDSSAQCKYCDKVFVLSDEGAAGH